MMQTPFQRPHPKDEATLRSMRWYALIIITLWTLAALALPVIAFCLTGDAFSFAGFTTLAPPVYIFSRIIKSFFPLPEKDYELQMLRILTDAQTQGRKKRMPPEAEQERPVRISRHRPSQRI